MKLKQGVSIFILLLFIGCESDEGKFAQAERECSQKSSVDRLEVSVYGCLSRTFC